VAGMNKGSTALVIDAPTLGEAAREQIGQADLWLRPLKASDTALTLLAQSFHDAASELLESERYDTGVLDTLLSFEQFLRDDGLSIKLTSDRRHGESFILDRTTFNTLQRVKRTTPEPRAILVSGFFDAIERSRRRFQLAMKTGEIIRGKIDESLVDIEQMRKLWAQQVTIKGTLHFNASGKPRFLEAQTVNASQAGDELFEAIDVPLSPTQMWKQVRTELSNRNVVAEIWGKWPGDESIEQLLDMLKSSEKEKMISG